MVTTYRPTFAPLNYSFSIFHTSSPFLVNGNVVNLVFCYVVRRGPGGFVYILMLENINPLSPGHSLSILMSRWPLLFIFPIASLHIHDS